MLTGSTQVLQGHCPLVSLYLVILNIYLAAQDKIQTELEAQQLNIKFAKSLSKFIKLALRIQYQLQCFYYALLLQPTWARPNLLMLVRAEQLQSISPGWP